MPQPPARGVDVQCDGALRCAVPREPAVGFKAVGGVLTACFFADLWGLGRVLRSGHAAGLGAGLCEPAKKLDISTRAGNSGSSDQRQQHRQQRSSYASEKTGADG